MSQREKYIANALLDDHRRAEDHDLVDLVAQSRERLRSVRRGMYRPRISRMRRVTDSSTDQDDKPSRRASDAERSESSSDSSSSSSEEDNGKNARKGKTDDGKKKTRRLTNRGALDLAALQELLSSVNTKKHAAGRSNMLDDFVLAPHPPPPPAPTVPDTTTITSNGSVPRPAPVDVVEVAQQVVQILQKQARKKEKPTAKSGSKVAFKRVDQVYDRRIHNYKLRETVQGDEKLDIWDQVDFMSFVECRRLTVCSTSSTFVDSSTRLRDTWPRMLISSPRY